MNRFRIFSLFAVSLVLRCAAFAALPPEVGMVATLPSAGLKLPLPGDAVAQPIPPAEARTYLHQQGSKSWTEDRYSALQLWYASQHVAEWSFPSRGSRLILGSVTIAPPVGFLESDISREQFVAYTNTPQASVASADNRLLHLWLQAFSGCSIGEFKTLPVGRTKLSHLYRCPTDRSDIHVWLFRFSRASGGLSYLPDVWLSLVSVRESASDGSAEAAFVEDVLLANLAPIGRFEGRETATERILRERAQKGVRPHPTRDAAHASISAYPDWWALDSNDYVLLSNDPSRKLAESLLADLQEARTLYAAKFPGFADTAEDVAVIRLFATEGEYEAYVGEDYAWSGGLYDGNRRELVIRPIPAKTRNAAYQRTLQTLLHEGFHQYVHQATGIATPAVWFNEGYASFFEGMAFRNRKAVFDEDPSRAKVLDAFLGVKPPQPIPLKALLVMDYQGYYSGSEVERSFKYALGWAFLYFLERGAPLVRNKPYADVLPVYYETLRTTGDGRLATLKAFEKVDLDALERDFRAFWTTPRDRSLAKRR